jgi:hypothetical protein
MASHSERCSESGNADTVTETEEAQKALKIFPSTCDTMMSMAVADNKAISWAFLVGFVVFIGTAFLPLFPADMSFGTSFIISLVACFAVAIPVYNIAKK